MKGIKTILSILLTILSLAIVVTGCGGGGGGSNDPGVPGGDTNTGAIGPEGGTITTDSGAIIVIPPGALDSTTTITITSYDTQSNLPANSGIMGNFIGGLVLSPDGLNLQIPATITIPLNDTITGGDEVKLFYYDEGDSNNSNYPANYSGWQQTDFTGTVSSNGQSVVAQIDHFSTYVIQMNFAGNTLDILGDMVETFGDNGLSVDFANYQTYFESNIAKIGDLHVYDLPGGFGYDCYKVVGIEYMLYHDMGIIYENPLSNFKGVKGEIAFFYNYEGDRFLLDGTQLIYHLFINVYIDRTPPNINLTAKNITVKPGEQTDVTARLTCGSEIMEDQDIYFSVNSLGSINPTQQKTNDNGDATITFTAGNEEGTATVTGEYSARDKDEIKIVSDSSNITIDDLPEIWSGTITYDFDYFWVLQEQAHYEIDYNFIVTRYYATADIDGVAIATQEVTLSNALDSWFFRGLNAPSTLNLIIEGDVSYSNNELYLNLSRDEAGTPFYVYEFSLQVPNEPVVWSDVNGLNALLIGNIYAGTDPVPLIEGTYYGTNSNLYGNHSYTITLVREQ
jgi:hypothetical protein